MQGLVEDVEDHERSEGLEPGLDNQSSMFIFQHCFLKREQISKEKSPTEDAEAS